MQKSRDADDGIPEFAEGGDNLRKRPDVSAGKIHLKGGDVRN
jgi:hypothetical protein